VILNLDHIAIAVPDLTEAIQRFSEDLGLTLSGTEAVESQKTETAFFPVSDPASGPAPRSSRSRLASPLFSFR